MDRKEFDEIRPYHDAELPQVYEELLSDPQFKAMLEDVLSEYTFDQLEQIIKACKTKAEFQKVICYPVIYKIIKNYTDGVTSDFSELTDKDGAYTFISNHRDITLDSSFLSVKLIDEGMRTVEIAIGDNLLIYPWIKQFVRINKSFIVQRALSMRQFLESSMRMSQYMHYAINDKHESIWIAQREGRAKDSSDRTQDSILKMIAMAGEGDIIDRIKEMNLAPLTLSYEYDPCDYLKAKEFQLKRDNPEYKKSKVEYMLNMSEGITGKKGRVHLYIAQCINGELDKIDRSLPKTELYSAISALIDKTIHRNYRIYPCNYVAYDMLEGGHTFADKYTDDEKMQFETYLNGQIAKIDIPNRDVDFLRQTILAMYVNPLKNYLVARQ